MGGVWEESIGFLFAFPNYYFFFFFFFLGFGL